jgi:hypothetical protein
VTPIRISFSSLRDSRWYEFGVRFALGGAVTVFAGLVSSFCGASVGGLFLALPAIFCASATLIEKHEIRRKRKAGLQGVRRGREAAALDACGAFLGAIGLLAFAGVFSCWWREAQWPLSSALRLPGFASLLLPGTPGAGQDRPFADRPGPAAALETSSRLICPSRARRWKRGIRPRQKTDFTNRLNSVGTFKSSRRNNSLSFFRNE